LIRRQVRATGNALGKHSVAGLLQPRFGGATRQALDRQVVRRPGSPAKAEFPDVRQIDARISAHFERQRIVKTNGLENRAPIS